MAYSANGYNFTSKSLSRVKYDLEYDFSGDLYRFKGKPQEEIKVFNVAANDVFFDSGDDFEPIWFDSTLLEYNYTDQIFFDVSNNKNFIVLSSAISSPCLEIVFDFINYKEWILENNIWDDTGIWMDTKTWND